MGAALEFGGVPGVGIQVSQRPLPVVEDAPEHSSTCLSTAPPYYTLAQHLHLPGNLGCLALGAGTVTGSVDFGIVCTG